MIKKHLNITNFLRAIPLIVFLGYYCCITLLMHTHVINGVTITHSHPYKGSPDNPAHEHTTSEIQLISILSQINCTDNFFTVFLDTPNRDVITLFTNYSPLQSVNEHKGISRLRAPPFFYNHSIS